jgi:hypothetical protein
MMSFIADLTSGPQVTNPFVNNSKTHPDVARQKAGEGWVLCRQKGGRQRS